MNTNENGGQTAAPGIEARLDAWMHKLSDLVEDWGDHGNGSGGQDCHDARRIRSSRGLALPILRPP